MGADRRVLVVDDEENIRFLVASALRLEGFVCSQAATGREALDAVQATSPHLIVLDVMLPDIGGFDLLQRLRGLGFDQPVIFVTAREATQDRVRGLTVGGDDYLVKPFAVEELVARVRAVLRRAGLSSSDSVLRYADLEMDDDARQVRRAGQLVALSPTEYKLLRYLLANAGRVLTRGQILDHVWEYDFDGETGVIESFISYLRRKVDAGHVPLIQTVRGVGYALRLEDAP